MHHYYVSDNAQSTGEHEVHRIGCSFMPNHGNKTYLGHFSNCREAILRAREIYSDVDGCYYCSLDCHAK
uniref:Uncharacterized protein n=1 Tax=Candidatus Kentrum sp. TC TaxID=2126339 RepID=A0A450ZF21_9GAMM|nr:MAG: hypothetical protein BECKTC1821D_GA0114238_11712 [Candidatus Kentron sp. TC]